MQKKAIYYFTSSAGALLLGVGLAGIVANLANGGFVRLNDPVFAVAMRNVCWVFSAITLIVAMICLFGRRLSVKVTVILCLAWNLILYWLSCRSNGVRGNFNSYLVGLGEAFGISSGTAWLLLEVIILFLLIGSSTALLWLWWDNRSCLEMFCPSCGTHIKYAAINLGLRKDCPHCNAAITLRRSEEKLKMSCFFCREHIEFPAHALGRKFKCPHCNMDITLNEPG